MNIRSTVFFPAQSMKEMVETLLRNGANVDAADRNFDTALHWASYHSKVFCLFLRLQNT